jgi:DNA (cytosine-5)-methyltransferase 1
MTDLDALLEAGCQLSIPRPAPPHDHGRLRLGSLFSGGGALDMAVSQVLGAEVVWHSEINPAASKVLAHRWPDVPNLGDITKVDWADVPPVDVLCGGFPCQDVSSAGRRAGLADHTRTGLWNVFADVIALLHPRLVVIENVRGLLSALAHRQEDEPHDDGPRFTACPTCGKPGYDSRLAADRDLEPGPAAVGDGPAKPVLRAAGAVLGDLADLLYHAQGAVVPAAAVGAPHRRERVFVLAWPDPGDAAARPVDLDAAEHDHPGRGRRATVVTGGLLPTPIAHDYEDAQTPEERNARGYGSHLRDIPHLVPTPLSTDGGSAYEGFGLRDWSTGVPRPGTAEPLLPTPNACDDGESQTPEARAARGFGPDLKDLEHLLPTPTAGEGGTNYNRDGGPGLKAVAASELLPTPVASEGSALHKGGNLTLTGATCGVDEKSAARLRPDLLPTPRATDPASSSSRSGEGFGPQLGEVARDLLPTPRAQDCTGRDGWANRDGGPDLKDIPDLLLPTPVAWQQGGPTLDNLRPGHSLPAFVNAQAQGRLLPTPVAFDAGSGKSAEVTADQHARGSWGDPNLGDQVVLDQLAGPPPLCPAFFEDDGELPLLATPRQDDTDDGDDDLAEEVGGPDFGRYAPAIRRWEAVTGVLAPAPTEPAQVAGGRARLNPAFAEWMMGWPAGHATACPGVSRSESLRVVGNGVCPQQAAAAIRMLLGWDPR